MDILLATDQHATPAPTAVGFALYSGDQSNRGLADDYLDDETSAYHDYLKASQLDPDWVWPKTELARFTVTPKEP